LIYLMG